MDIESVEALINAIKGYEGGVVLVTHDARLIQSCDFDLWECNYGVVDKVPGGFDEYKNRIMKTLDERQENIEKQAVERAAKRALERKRLKYAFQLI